jgi:uncharacterized protein (DUF433 family)
MKEDPRLFKERITADPRILGGKPVVRGTRIAVSLVLEELAQNPDKAMVTGEDVSPKPPKGVRTDAPLV